MADFHGLDVGTFRPKVDELSGLRLLKQSLDFRSRDLQDGRKRLRNTQERLARACEDFKAERAGLQAELRALGDSGKPLGESLAAQKALLERQSETLTHERMNVDLLRDEVQRMREEQRKTPEDLRANLPESPEVLNPPSLTDSAPLLCVRSLSAKDHDRESSDEVKAFSHEQTRRGGSSEPTRRSSNDSNNPRGLTPGWFQASETCADASRDFAALVKSVLKMEHAHARQLIETGVSVNMALREEHKGSVHFSTLLHAVCDLPVADSSGQIQIIQLLLEATANINPRDSRGLTPLMCACRQKNVEVVKLLLSHGARVQPCDTSGHNCLNWAAALREEAEPLTCYSPRAPLTDDEPWFEELQLYSEALGKRDSKSFPPLRMAVMQQNVSAALVMMACGAAPIWLHDAVRVGSLELVHALLHFDADPAKQDSSGASSIDTAVQLGTDWEIVEVLRENVHKAVSNLRLSESSSAPSPVRRISITSVTSGRSPPNHPRSPSSRSISFMRSISPKDPEDTAEPEPEGSFGGSFMQNLQRPLIFNWMPAKSRKIFESNAFQCIMFCMLAMALYLPDIYAITDAEYYTLDPGHQTDDVLLVLIFVFFTLDAVLQVIGIGKAYILSFFCLMDIIGTLNSLTQNSVVMRATRASKIGARAGRLTRLTSVDWRHSKDEIPSISAKPEACR
eukprot:g17689.t1